MRFVFTSNVQIGTFGCKQTATSLLRASPAITIHSGSEKIERQTIAFISLSCSSRHKKLASLVSTLCYSVI